MPDPNGLKRPRYSASDLARFRENYAETEFLVHVLGPDMTIVADDENKPFTLAEADRLARRVNDARSPLGWQHATVFHYGRPLVAPDAVAKAPEFSAEDLAWFKETWGATGWVAYVHGQDECIDRPGDEDGPLFTEETLRRFVANTVLLDREMTYQGYDAPIPVSVFHFGEPFALETAVAQ
jgi:hypothetical protein